MLKKGLPAQMSFPQDASKEAPRTIGDSHRATGGVVDQLTGLTSKKCKLPRHSPTKHIKTGSLQMELSVMFWTAHNKIFTHHKLCLSFSASFVDARVS